MNSLDVLAYSGERLSFFQLFSQKRLQVQIPIIQRDYAQGRDNQSAVRTAFLDALYEYLHQGKPYRDLDFVYGSVVENLNTDEQTRSDKTVGRFIPLDGQQRLTTLFLLHWYLAQISGKAEYLRSTLSNSGRSLFTYETRNSSKEFCDALMTHDIDFDALLKGESDIPNIAATIKDQGWFFLSWENDPTICAMLVMLNAIHNKFSACSDFFDLLVDKEKPVITFLFLNLQEFKLTDDLYIKMNARGKPLTHFENFKARLEKKIKTFQEPWPDYKLHFQEKPVSGYKYFIHKIDTDWADLFWAYRNEASKDDTYDDELMNFIALVAANFHILNNEFESNLFGAGGSLKRLAFSEYEELGCLTQNLLVQLITMFDLLHHDALIEGHLSPYLAGNRYYSEEEIFKKVVKNNTSYPEKLRFYAFYHALSNGLRDDELLSWMRVIFNLTENTIVNTLDDYYNQLKSIQAMLKRDKSILEQLQNDEHISAFTEAQITEEKVKALLLARSVEWEQEVIELETHPFFQGQIGFILKFAGIVNYYQEHGNTDWGISDSDYLERFRHYARSASAVFSCIADSSEKINYAWERAVLTKGEYFTEMSSNRFNLLSTRLSKNNIERDHSWKRLLRLPLNKNDHWNKKQEYVKAVFDDPDFDKEDVRGSLETVCKKALSTLDSNDWRIVLVENPALFQVCHQGFIVKSEEEIVLLHESQRNHYHSELYSKYLYLKLEAEGFDPKPFIFKEYVPGKGADNYTYISLASFYYDEYCYEIEVWYESNHYDILFSESRGSPFPKSISEILLKTGFIIEQKYEEYKGAYSFSCEMPNEAKQVLNNLCENLRNLHDD